MESALLGRRADIDERNVMTARTTAIASVLPPNRVEHLMHLVIALAGSLGLLSLAGCSASASLNNPFAGEPGADERPRLAAFAASSQYPSTRPSDDLRVTAVVDRDAGTIRLFNPTDRTIRGADVWVNGSFVNRVESIPANGSITLNRARFSDGAGRTLASTDTTASRIELESDGKFHTLLGPVFD